MATTAEKTLYSFPNGPSPDAVEWPGTPIAARNTITRTKGRTKVHDKTVDAKPGLLTRLLANAFQGMVTQQRDTYSHDVVIHGIRVRAVTNSEHLISYWRDNWYSVSEWERTTGQKVAESPHVLTVALGGVATEAEAAYYSRGNNMVIFFNTSYYGQLKSWVLGAVGRYLASEYGVHSIHGAVVEKDGKGILYIAPTGTGKSTSSYGVMEFPNTRFHSDDWVYIRYAYRTKDGRLISPLRIEQQEREVARGYQCFGWIESHHGDKAVVHGRGLDDKPITVPAADLDLSLPTEAYAYTSEKVFYLRSNLVENFPVAAFDIIKSHLENAPDVSAEFMRENKGTIDAVVATLRADPHFKGSPFERMSEDELRTTAARLFAFENTRAMLDITTVFPKERVYTNPMEPCRITTVMLLKRNFDEDVVAKRLSLDEFMARLMIGLTPMGTKEIVYNSYRAVDDVSERKWLDKLEAQGVDKMWRLYRDATDRPETLQEEFELFRTLYQSAKAYDVNTVIQKDPAVHSKMEAVARTMRLISKLHDSSDQKLTATTADYTKLTA
ncbi:MAG: hypothetical protein AUH85_10165 [Chloroflexi bacterium 13_1_40CM_4_68_4]|nr:MAG: hypothetical protein AUH85_10165 [Chloroflexi bacterium 13_1_40CM_4_68_4]